MEIPASEIAGIGLRRMIEADVPAADELVAIGRWNQTSADWRRLLGLEPEGCFVAMEHGRLVGTVTTITHGRTLGWIGMMLVHPNHRRQGTATRLMRQAIAYLESRPVKCIKLDATPAGRLVYERLGFSAEGTITRHRRTLESEPALPRPASFALRAKNYAMRIGTKSMKSTPRLSAPNVRAGSGVSRKAAPPHWSGLTETGLAVGDCCAPGLTRSTWGR